MNGKDDIQSIDTEFLQEKPKPTSLESFYRPDEFTPEPYEPIFNPDGSLQSGMARAMQGPMGERLGYVSARDEGFWKEGAKGLVKGTVGVTGSFANTFGADKLKAWSDDFLATNRQLDDSDRKGTWSYIANVAGSQIGQNLPLLAATIGAGILTGGTGAGAVAGIGRGLKGAQLAEAVIGRKVLASQLTGAGMVGAMTWGDNLDELRERLPDMSESDRVAIALPLTILQSWIEVAFGATPRIAKSVARASVAEGLAQAGGFATMKTVGKNVMNGKIAQFRNSFAGQWLGTGVTETFEELLQQSSMDMSVSLFSKKPQLSNAEQWSEFIDKYGRILKEGFIGGMALGLLPATLNAYSNSVQRKYMSDLLTRDQGKMDGIHGKVGVDGAIYVDADELNKTTFMFNTFVDSLGFGRPDIDPAKRTSAIENLRTLCYNLAVMERKAEPDPAKRAAILPERYIQTLSTLVPSNPAASQRLFDVLGKPDVTKDEVIGAIDKIQSDFGDTINSMSDYAEAFELEKTGRELVPELKVKLSGNPRTPMSEIRKNLVSVASGIAKTVMGSKSLPAGESLARADVRSGMVVSPNAIERITARMGEESARRLFAIGWIDNIKVGEKTWAIKLVADKTGSGRIGGILFSQEEATPLIKETDEILDWQRLEAKGKTNSKEFLSKSRSRLIALGIMNDRFDAYTGISERLSQTRTEEMAGIEKAILTEAEEEQRIKKINDEAPARLESFKAKTTDANVPIADRIKATKDLYDEASKDLLSIEDWYLLPADQVPAIAGTVREMGEIIGGLEKEAGVVKPSVSDWLVLQERAKKQAKPKAEAPPPDIGGRAQYIPHMELIIKGTQGDAASIMHELMHHLVENNLVPNELMSVLRQNFVVGDDKDRQLNVAEKENISNAMLAYVVEGKVPSNPALAKAFDNLKSIIAASVKANQRDLGLLVPEGEVGYRPSGAKVELSEQTKKMFEALLTTPIEDSIAELYGHALDQSLELGWTGGGVQVVDRIAIQDKMKQVSDIQKVNLDQMAQALIERYHEAIGKSADMSKMSVLQLSNLDRILEDELEKAMPARGTSKEQERPLFERMFEPYAVTVERRRKMAGAEKIEAKIRAIKRDLMMNPKNENLKRELARLESDLIHISAGDFQRMLVFQEKSIEEFNKETDVDKRIGEKRSYLIGSLYKGAKEAAWYPRMRELFGAVSDTKSLSESQLDIAILDKQEQLRSERKVKQREFTPENQKKLDDMTASLTPGLHQNLNSLVTDSILTKLGKKLVGGAHRVLKNIFDPRTLVRWISNNAPAWVDNIVKPLSNGWNRRSVENITFRENFKKDCKAKGIDFNAAVERVVVKNRNFIKSDLLDIWFVTNYGTVGMDDVEVKKLMKSDPSFTPEIVKEMVSMVRADNNLRKLGDLMQEYNSKYFERAADVRERLTGERPQPIARAYTRGEYEGDALVTEDVEGQFQNMAFVNREGVRDTPNEFKHRTPDPGSKYNTDAFSKFFRHIDTLINYEAKAENIAGMLTLLETDEMRTAFIENYGEDTYREAIIKLIWREMSPNGHNRRNAPGERGVTDILHNAHNAFLGYNINTVSTQATAIGPSLAALDSSSIPRLFANISRTFFSTASNASIEATEAYKLVKKYSPYIIESLWPTKAQETFANLLQEAGTGGFKWHSRRFAEFQRFGMFPMQATDMLIRLSTYQTAFETKIKELIDSGKSQSEMGKEAALWAEEVLLKSQNPAGRGETGLLQTESSAAIRSLLAFTSQPFANMKMFLTDVALPVLSAYEKSGLMGAAKEVLSNGGLYRKIVFGAFLPGLALGAIGRRRPQKNLEEVLTDAILMGLCNLIPVAGNILWFGAITGFEGKSSFAGMHGQLMKSITDFITKANPYNEKPLFTSIPDAMRAVELMTGIPDFPIKVTSKILEEIYIEGGKFDGKTVWEAMRGSRMD